MNLQTVFCELLLQTPGILFLFLFLVSAPLYRGVAGVHGPYDWRGG
jgi:hypothetical protein